MACSNESSMRRFSSNVRALTLILKVVNINWLDGGKAAKIGKDKKPTQSHFIVKIQVPRQPLTELFINGGVDSDTPKKPMLLYDEGRNIYGYIGAENSVYKPLFEIIESKGLDGLKGYFCALFDSNGQLKVNITDILLPKDW